MINISLNARSLEKTMNNIVNYSYGFLDGAQQGKKIFLTNIGANTVEVLKRYIDLEARANQQALHHIYEWYQVGSPSARLFDINYVVGSGGLKITSSFRQSRSISEDANSPFFNKAKIMEDGTPVTISPKNEVLVFNESGKTIFTRKSVTILNPGGDDVAGSFERVFDQFMSKYFAQSFLRASGLYDYLSSPRIYKKNISQGAKFGRSKGVSTGFKWITNANVEVE